MTKNVAYMSSTLRTCQESQRSAPSPRLARDDLDGHDDDERVAETEPEPGEDERQRAGSSTAAKSRRPGRRSGRPPRRRARSICRTPCVVVKATRKNEVTAIVSDERRPRPRGTQEAHERQEQHARDRIDHGEDRIEAPRAAAARAPSRGPRPRRGPRRARTPSRCGRAWCHAWPQACRRRRASPRWRSDRRRAREERRRGAARRARPLPAASSERGRGRWRPSARAATGRRRASPGRGPRPSPGRPPREARPRSSRAARHRPGEARASRPRGRPRSTGKTWLTRPGRAVSSTIAVAQQQRLLEGVGDVDDGLAELAPRSGAAPPA